MSCYCAPAAPAQNDWPPGSGAHAAPGFWAYRKNAATALIVQAIQRARNRVAAPMAFILR